LSDKINNIFSKILVAIDGSQPSIDAANYAIEMAKKNNNSQLIALTVLDISTPRRLSSSFITAPTYGLKELEEERKRAQKWLESISNKVQEIEKNIQYKAEIIEGSISVEGTIVDYAENENIDLIVIGTRGRSGFKRMLLGSVASKVVTYATCPVLVIK
jgi:nucleotide-binding universal stress UspA family protein